MSVPIKDETIYRLAAASRQCAFGAKVARAVSVRFRSMQYLSSKLLCDCICLNVLLNDLTVSPTSADEIITIIRRRNPSFYTTVNSAFFPIEDAFEEYARTVLADDYEVVKSLGLRTANYIVYVISLDISRDENANPYEIYSEAFTYAELEKFDLLPR